MLVYLHSLLERPVRLGVRTGDFHSSNRGSIPLRATKASSDAFFYWVLDVKFDTIVLLIFSEIITA